MTNHLQRARRMHAMRMLVRITEIQDGVFRSDRRGASAALTTLGRFWDQIAHAQSWSSGAALEDRAAAELCAEFARIAAPLMRGRMPLETRQSWLDAGVAAAGHGKQRAVLGARGELSLDRRDYWEAASDFELALTSAIAEGSAQAQGQELDSLGLAFAGIGDVDAAERYHRMALEKLREAGDRIGEAVVLNNLARVALRDGDAYLALERFEAAAEITGGTPPEARKGLGEGALIVGNAELAKSQFERALDGFRALGVVNSELETVPELASAIARLGERDRAFELLDQAVTEARDGAWLHELFVLLERQVELELAAGRLADARAHVAEARTVAASLGSVDRRRALQSAAAVALAGGDAPRALALLEDALAVVEDVNRQLVRMGGRRLELEGFGPAPDDDFAVMAVTIGDIEGRRSVLVALGDAHLAGGHVAAAVARYEEALEAMGDRVSRLRAETYRRLGDALTQRDDAADPPAAIAWYEQAIEVARRLRDRHWEADMVGEIGTAHWRAKDFERAEEWYLKALAIDREIGGHQDATHVLGQLGHMYFEGGRLDDAAARYSEAAEIARDIGYEEIIPMLELHAGLVMWELGRRDEAPERFSAAVEAARRLGALEAEARALEALYAALMKAGRDVEATAAADRHDAIRRMLDGIARQEDASST